MIQRTIVIILSIVSISLYSCTPASEGEQDNRSIEKDLVEKEIITENTKQVTFEEIAGTWKLVYRGNYGYEFRLYPSYKAVVILYLRTESLIFKGVYTIEPESIVRININEIKREKRITGLGLTHGFTRAKSSYFQFKGSLSDDINGKTLIFRPVRIIMDGNSSDGYFEPIIKLKKIR